MKPKLPRNNPFDCAHEKAKQVRAAALRGWQEANPALAECETHQLTFLAGYESAAGPLPPTADEWIAKVAKKIAVAEKQKQQRLAAMPPGTCLTCEGEGEFVGATHITKCVDCHGTGKVTSQEGGAA